MRKSRAGGGNGSALNPQVIHTSTAGMVGPGCRNPGESTPTIVYRSLSRRRLRPRTPGSAPYDRSLRLDNDLYTIVGVLSPGFRSLSRRRLRPRTPGSAPYDRSL